MRDINKPLKLPVVKLEHFPLSVFWALLRLIENPRVFACCPQEYSLQYTTTHENYGKICAGFAALPNLLYSLGKHLGYGSIQAK